jgi:KTSC domain-containing protein
MPSSVVARFSYDPVKSILKVIYTSGAIYEYEDVPEDVYKAMKSSFSKGTFLNIEIKGRYNYKKLA